MQLHQQLWGGALLLVVLFGGVSRPLAAEESDLRPLLGVWKFHVFLEDEELGPIFLFVDDIQPEAGQLLARGRNLRGLPLRGANQSSSPHYQYSIGWEEPPASGQWFFYEFNFVTDTTVGGVFWMLRRGEGRTPPMNTMGFRVCSGSKKDRKTCVYQ